MSPARRPLSGVHLSRPSTNFDGGCMTPEPTPSVRRRGPAPAQTTGLPVSILFAGPRPRFGTWRRRLVFPTSGALCAFQAILCASGRWHNPHGQGGTGRNAEREDDHSNQHLRRPAGYRPIVAKQLGHASGIARRGLADKRLGRSRQVRRKALGGIPTDAPSLAGRLCRARSERPCDRSRTASSGCRSGGRARCRSRPPERGFNRRRLGVCRYK